VYQPNSEAVAKLNRNNLFREGSSPKSKHMHHTAFSIITILIVEPDGNKCFIYANVFSEIRFCYCNDVKIIGAYKRHAFQSRSLLLMDLN